VPLFSGVFQLRKSQAELDFVDVPLHTDIPLFVDPFAISRRPERWSQEAHATISAFFQRAVDLIRRGDMPAAEEHFGYLREPNETRFGFSRGRPQGAGIGAGQSRDLLQALARSTAVRTGFITSLQECELMVPGIAHDKISDMTTNVIRRHLVDYTQAQALLHGIGLRQVPMGPFYDPATGLWETAYVDLPVWRARPVILVPKAVARYDPAYSGEKYYNGVVLNFLRAEALDAGSGLVRTLKHKQVVYKKDLKQRYPYSKEFLYEFSRAHPEVLREYRETLERLEKEGKASSVEPEDLQEIARALAAALRAIAPGGDQAADYHSLMIGVMELLFFPSLLNPRKEKEIHEGRKRIDIVMENGARDGIFFRLHALRNLPCAFIPIECKNYGREIGNPELDQLSGRFSPNRGKAGILCCRSVADRDVLLRRCRDTHRDDRGLIIPIDDDFVIGCLELVAAGREREIDDRVGQLVAEVWLD